MRIPVLLLPLLVPLATELQAEPQRHSSIRSPATANQTLLPGPYLLSPAGSSTSKFKWVSKPVRAAVNSAATAPLRASVATDSIPWPQDAPPAQPFHAQTFAPAATTPLRFDYQLSAVPTTPPPVKSAAAPAPVTPGRSL